MLLNGQILTGSTQTIATKKGDHLQKTRLKVLDLGVEASGGDLYWIDFLGEAALTDDELRAVARQQVELEVRRMYASKGAKGGAYLNANGGQCDTRAGSCSAPCARAVAPRPARLAPRSRGRCPAPRQGGVAPLGGPSFRTLLGRHEAPAKQWSKHY